MKDRPRAVAFKDVEGLSALGGRRGIRAGFLEEVASGQSYPSLLED